ncbi:MAG: Grx4 family monothiol glutaredoxin [Proteobacteria bacterium]|nr:Grx4 family monothiol glutaredoxin [Pseudomonadota bacterium]MCH8057592.1 Grx4 family monothiol glutaredoxin [Pseudomonadota bacterium]
MSLSESVKNKIDNYVHGNKVVLFMKGTPQQPQCGFSAKTIAALDSLLPDYASVNVLEDPAIRDGIKEYGNWPTIPQLYINGELVGGCDIVLNMLNSGELHACLNLEAPDRTPPEITVTSKAAAQIKESMQGHEGFALHFQVDANWNSQFNLAPAEGNEISTESNGVRILMDLATAQRARGAVIDWVSSIQGDGLAVDLPQAPPPVKQMTVQELAEKLAAGTTTLVDIRGDDEREQAFIDGAKVLTKEVMEQLEQMPKVSEIAFLCHHGNASQGAAEYFRKKGFTKISNVAGGINAWSLEIDSSVPTY